MKEKGYLTSDIIDCCELILSKGSTLEKYVATWCLENIVPLKELSDLNQDRWTILPYDEFVINKLVIIDLLKEKLKLASDQPFYQVDKPSQTVRDKKTFQNIVNNDENKRNNYLLAKWMDEIKNETKIRVQKIFDTFGYEIYNAYEPFPSKEIFNSEHTLKLIREIN